MPFDSGNLQNESAFVDYRNEAGKNQTRKTTLVVQHAYARRLYYYHPNTTSRQTRTRLLAVQWYEPWLPGGDISQDLQRMHLSDFTGK